MGAFGIGPSDAPDLQIAGLDPVAQAIINQTSKTANQSPDQIAEIRNRGVSDAGMSPQQSTQHANQSAAAFGSNPSMNQAIRNQYQQVAGQNINDVVRSNQLSAPFIQQEQLRNAAAARAAQQHVETGNFSALMDAQNQMTIARSRAIGALINLGGVIAGNVIGGMSQKGAPMTRSTSEINDLWDNPGMPERPDNQMMPAQGNFNSNVG